MLVHGVHRRFLGIMGPKLAFRLPPMLQCMDGITSKTARELISTPRDLSFYLEQLIRRQSWGFHTGVSSAYAEVGSPPIGNLPKPLGTYSLTYSQGGLLRLQRCVGNTMTPATLRQSRADELVNGHR
jgi:hypothetical protein